MEKDKKLKEKRIQHLLDSLTTGFISGGIMLLASFMGDAFHYKWGFDHWYIVPLIVAVVAFYFFRYLLENHL
jgi:hypothetical protein